MRRWAHRRRNGAKITAACQTELPEGCLINGIITNEAELTAALQGFFAANELPTQRVALAAGRQPVQPPGADPAPHE